MTFLEKIFERLQRASSVPVLGEVRDRQVVFVTGGELLALVEQVRTFLNARGFKKGDRCALLAPNSIRWAALDLAMMAEGIIVVPLYARQAPAELAAMLKDSTPVRICCSDARLAAEIVKFWPAAPKISLLDGIFTGDGKPATKPFAHADSDPLTIIYTSGTSGEPKGVLLNAGNVNFMLERTGGRLDELMSEVKKTSGEAERIFHYLPFCFAASWILLLTALSRNSVLTLSTDLSKLSDELKLAEPDYFLNVPTLLERVRGKIEEAVRQKGGFAARMFSSAQRAYANRLSGKGTIADSVWLHLATSFMFPTIRTTIGANLKALISGSAPLSPETQQFFMMIGIPVLQAYGLTETTAICTLDVPGRVEPGRVGPAIPGIEMSLGENDEILVRGPNIFSGYWQRPEATAKVLEGGWFHTGDQGEKDANGNWRISGRLKNLIILNSGHNVAPEPLEDALARELPEAEQVVILGNQRSFLAVLVTAQPSNGLKAERVQAAVDAANSGLPHYKTIRAFHIVPEPLTIENGMLTANGKLKRDAIVARFAAEIERLFEKKERMKDFRGETLSWNAEGGVIELVLDRAPCNEIGSTTLAELEKFVGTLDLLQKDCHALIISSPRAEGFCAGADLRELYHRSQALPPAERVPGVRDFVERIHRVGNVIDAAPLTTIAAVHGVTFGGGFELALLCDLIVADKMTRFCFPELRLGLIPSFGGIPRLKRDIGNGVVRDLLLTGRSINASKAQAIGLVSQVTGEGDALRVARATATQVAKFDRDTAVAAKKLIKPIPYAELEQEVDIFCELFTRPAVEAGLRKFVESTDALPYLP